MSLDDDAFDPKSSLCEGVVAYGQERLPFIRVPFIILQQILTGDDLKDKVGRYLAMFAARLLGGRSGSPGHLSWTVHVVDEAVALTTTEWTDRWPQPTEWPFLKRHVYLFTTTDPDHKTSDWFTAAISMKEPNWQSAGMKAQKEYSTLFPAVKGDSGTPSAQSFLRDEVVARDRFCILTEEDVDHHAAHLIPQCCGGKFIVAAFAQAHAMTCAERSNGLRSLWTPVASPWDYPERFGKFSVYNAVLLKGSLNPNTMERFALLATPNMWLEESDVTYHPRKHDPRPEHALRGMRFTLHYLKDLVVKNGNAAHDKKHGMPTSPPEDLGVIPEYLQTGMNALLISSAGRDCNARTPVSDEILKGLKTQPDRLETALLPPVELLVTVYCATLMYWFRTGEVDSIMQTLCLAQERASGGDDTRRNEGDGEDGTGGGAGDGGDEHDLGPDEGSRDSDADMDDTKDSDFEPDGDEDMSEEECDAMAQYCAALAMLCQLPLPSRPSSTNSSFSSAGGLTASSSSASDPPRLPTPADGKRRDELVMDRKLAEPWTYLLDPDRFLDRPIQ